uniref:Reverse transcriptase domain-containing protein n=1 Tax=Lactuca sativa TaxID=4236 RepID=A0A9R1WW14_LACSA|nr:hypothetical protein LSAT_V11C800425000 [Lactuca sativa]
MQFMGFGLRRRLWSIWLFKNSKCSFLLIGRRTNEFQVFRGLRQGDPISPFLFIIFMGGLHFSMEDVVASGIFRGVRVRDSNLFFSHLFYVDNVLFMGDWDEITVRNHINILRGFLMGVGVADSEVVSLASFTGFAVTSFLFSYLGIPVSGGDGRRPIRGGGESMQLENILSILSSVVLSTVPDKWSWDLDPSGCFSVKSASVTSRVPGTILKALYSF